MPGRYRPEDWCDIHEVRIGYREEADTAVAYGQENDGQDKEAKRGEHHLPRAVEAPGQEPAVTHLEAWPRIFLETADNVS